MAVHARYTSLELCAGSGGLALGLESAGFSPVALVEKDEHACNTLRVNRPGWNVIRTDLAGFDPADHAYTYDVDLLSAGLPRVRSTASVARSGDRYEREILKAAVYLVGSVQPRVVLIENVPRLVDAPEFEDIRAEILAELRHLDYELHWKILNAKDYGVPQERRHGVLVALKQGFVPGFRWPDPLAVPPPSVAEVLYPSMASRGWLHAGAWADRAKRLAPTIVGGSPNRGGADLGPRGAKRTWARMGINGGTVANDVPKRDTGWDPDGDPRHLPALTVPQVALLQGFPETWQFSGGKTSRYRQVGHAFPPPMATALGRQIAATLPPNAHDSSPTGPAG